MNEPTVKIDPKTTGAWLVHHTNKLQHVVGVGSFDNVLVAGKAAILLSVLSATQQGRDREWGSDDYRRSYRLH